MPTTIYGRTEKTAASAPTPATAGVPGDHWRDTSSNVVYRCLDATPSAAIWAPINGYGYTSASLHSPIALWHLDGGLTDAVGSLDLSVGAGSAVYSSFGGRKAFRFTGASYLERAANDAALTITGDLTVAMVMSHLNPFAVNVPISFGGDAGSAAENILFSWATNAAGGLTHTHHSGTRSAQTHTTVDGYIGGGWGQHVCAVRGSNTITWYVDGILVGATSSALTAAAGGGSSRLIVGAAEDAGSKFLGAISDVAIYNTALTAAQVRAQSLRTVGR